jgi:hypothetical protein
MARWWRPARLWHQHETPATAASETDQALPFQELYLRRLHRLVLLNARPALTDEERRLLNHALDVTYRDCVSVGARQQARAMLGLPRH